MTGRKEQVLDQDPGVDEPERDSEAPGASTVVFYGDPKLVSDTFDLALKAMDASAALWTAGDIVARPKTSDS
jgi:hypothetical protein